MCLGTTGVITALRDDDGVLMASIDAGGRPCAVTEACLLTCPEAGVGDTVLVHSGYVLQILDPREDPS